MPVFPFAPKTTIGFSDGGATGAGAGSVDAVCCASDERTTTTRGDGVAARRAVVFERRGGARDDTTVRKASAEDDMTTAGREVAAARGAAGCGEVTGGWMTSALFSRPSHSWHSCRKRNDSP